MINLDFHFPKYQAEAESDRKIPVTSGYGLAYRDMLHAIQSVLHEFDHIRLTPTYEGGDIQIYFGSVWKKQEEFLNG